MIRLNNYRIGIIAESLATIFLFLKGYKIIARRYKSKLGEIDIIAKKRNKLHFIEVKTSRKEIDIEKVLTPLQVNRIKRCAEHFLHQNQLLRVKQINFDLVLVKNFTRVTHLVNFLD